MSGLEVESDMVGRHASGMSVNLTDEIGGVSPKADKEMEIEAKFGHNLKSPTGSSMMTQSVL